MLISRFKGQLKGSKGDSYWWMKGQTSRRLNLILRYEVQIFLIRKYVIIGTTGNRNLYYYYFGYSNNPTPDASLFHFDFSRGSVARTGIFLAKNPECGIIQVTKTLSAKGKAKGLQVINEILDRWCARSHLYRFKGGLNWYRVKTLGPALSIKPTQPGAYINCPCQ